MIEIRDKLVRRSEELLAGPKGTVVLSGVPEADQMLNDLGGQPHAFVLGCIMDRQIKAERAWLIPFEIHRRTGTSTFEELAGLSLAAIRRAMTSPSALHRFTADMSVYFHEGVGRIRRVYGGDASTIWSGDPPSAAVVRRFLEFRGIGPKIATMAVNILVRDFRIPTSDKFAVDISPDVQVRRVLIRLGLLDENASNEQLIYLAREMSPEYPGIFDFSLWEVGREWCRPRTPDCGACFLNDVCPSASQV